MMNIKLILLDFVLMMIFSLEEFIYNYLITFLQCTIPKKGVSIINKNFIIKLF